MLGDTGGLGGGCHVVAALDGPEKIFDELPRDPWDFQANSILTPVGFDVVSEKGKSPGIIWDDLEMDRIKRVTPLWKHYVATRENR